MTYKRFHLDGSPDEICETITDLLKKYDCAITYLDRGIAHRFNEISVHVDNIDDDRTSKVVIDFIDDGDMLCGFTYRYFREYKYQVVILYKERS